MNRFGPAALLLPVALSITGCGATHTNSESATAVATAGALATKLAPATSTFDVHWKPETTVVDDKTIAAAYRGVAKDGSLAFDAQLAPKLATLAPGSVVVFSGLALRKVVSAHSDGATISLVTSPAALDDAVTDGHIAWKLPVDFARIAQIAPPGFHRVLVAEDSTWERFFFESASADAGAGVHYAGDVKDWAVDLTLTPENGDLHMEIDAKKTGAGGGTIALHAVGELDSLTDSVDIALANGSTTKISFDNGNLHGKVAFTWNVAFDAAHGGEDIKTLNEAEVEKLPIGLSVPFLVGPLPFSLKVKAAFAFSPFFSSKTTVAQGEYHTSFGGDVSMDESSTAPATSAGNVQGTGDIASYGGTLSVAPLGLSTTMMLPKIQLTLGAPEPLESVLGETAGGPYFAMMTQANFVATGPLSIVPCERRELDVIAIVGADASLLGHSIGKTDPKTIFSKNYSEIVPNNIKLCQSS